MRTMIIAAVAALGFCLGGVGDAKAQTLQPYYYYTPNTRYVYGYTYPGTTYSPYYSAYGTMPYYSSYYNPYWTGYTPGMQAYNWSWYSPYTGYRNWRWYRRW